MKTPFRFLIIILLIFILSVGMGLTNAPFDHVVWRDYEEGIAFAKKTHKPIMITFLSERCRYCKRMERNTFTAFAVVKTLNEKFVSIKVDVMKDVNLARMYGATYVPSIFFLTPQEEGIGKVIGYRTAHNLLPALEFVGDGFYQRMDFEDYLRMRGDRKK